MAKMSFDLFGALSPNDGESKVRMALFLIKYGIKPIANDMNYISDQMCAIFK